MVLCAGLLCGSSVIAEEQVSTQEAEGQPGLQSQGAWQWWGTILEEYRGRFAVAPAWSASPTEVQPTSARDQDLKLYLDGGFADPSDRFGANLSLGLWIDTDGSRTGLQSNHLEGIYNTGKEIWFDVFALSAEYRSGGILRLARAGRQVSEHGLSVTFDGGSVLLNGGAPWIDFFVFGGRTTHFFEIDGGLFEDWIGSAGVVTRPSKWLQLEADYRFYREVVAQKDPPEQTPRLKLFNNSYGLLLKARKSDWLFVKVFVRGLDASVSHTGAGLKLAWEPWGLGGSAEAVVQLATLKEFNEQDDPIFAVLGQSQANLRLRLDIWKTFDTGFGDFGLHLGWSGRQRLGGEDSPFNRSFGKAYLLFDVHDLGIKGLFANLAAEGHYDYNSGKLLGDWILAVAGAAGYEGHGVKAEAGTYYQRFKYQYYLNVHETEDVRTVYTSLAWKLVAWLTVKAKYELEWTDRYVHTVTATVLQSF